MPLYILRCLRCHAAFTHAIILLLISPYAYAFYCARHAVADTRRLMLKMLILRRFDSCHASITRRYAQQRMPLPAYDMLLRAPCRAAY